MRIAVSVALAPLALVAPASAQTVAPTGLGFSTALHDDAGRRVLLVRSATMAPVMAGSRVGELELADMHLTRFSEGNPDQIDMIFVSPRGFFVPDSRQARGNSGVRVLYVGGGMEIAGNHWSYDDATHEVTVEQNVKATIQASLASVWKSSRVAQNAGTGPTDITADRLHVTHSGNTSTLVLQGNVVAANGTSRITCQRLVIVSSRLDDKDAARVPVDQRIHSLVATGDVRIVQPDAGREATAGRAEFEPRAGKVTLTDQPRVIGRDPAGAILLDATGQEFVLLQADNQLLGRQINLVGPAHKGFGLGGAGSAATPVPTRLTAAEIDMREIGDETIATCTGEVSLAGTGLVLHCDRLVAVSARAAGVPVENQFKSIVATGDVRIAQSDGRRQAECDRAEITPPLEKMVLTGTPEVVDRGPTGEIEYRCTGDEFTLLGREGRLSGRNITLTGPSLKDLGPATADAAATPVPTVLQAARLDMRQDGDDTIILVDGDVTGTGTNLRISSDNLVAISTRVTGGAGQPGRTRQELTSVVANSRVRMTLPDYDLASGRADILPLQNQIVLTGNPEGLKRSTRERVAGSRVTLHGRAPDAPAGSSPIQRVIVETPRAEGSPVDESQLQKLTPSAP